MRQFARSPSVARHVTALPPPLVVSRVGVGVRFVHEPSGLAPPPPRADGVRTPPRVPSRHPMELLSSVFQSHPHALRLHRELTVAIADGDSARASDLAGVLASTVQRVVASHEAGGDTAAPAGPPGARDSELDLPAARPEDVEQAMDKTHEVLLRHVADVGDRSAARMGAGDGATSASAATAAGSSLPFWRDPQQLCVTVLESAFETEVPDGEAQDTLSPAGNRAAEHEAAQMRILESYLERDSARWKAQKSAVAKVVLEVARSMGVTPEDLQSAEGATAPADTAVAPGEQRLNVLRHSNIVVRGEMPAAAVPGGSVDDSVAEELRALQQRMADLGQPLTAEEVCMARYELQMSKSKMRYVVGVHKELQLALDHSTTLRDAPAQQAQAAATPTLTGTERFMAEVIRSLNEGADAYGAKVAAAGESLTLENVEARKALEAPVLPFTFMLKCCLWFTTTPAQPPSAT
ncbi:hypothetical protein NESM_000033600 [Novymonas esmeraldas]|uniref:Uncharacterized protein n=1 Tax=Novymonas esmeraldas TaxID=1808958 RepID=A0AAW0F3S9_9TRYP